jgi:hypothetical protein
VGGDLACGFGDVFEEDGDEGGGTGLDPKLSLVALAPTPVP